MSKVLTLSGAAAVFTVVFSGAVLAAGDTPIAAPPETGGKDGTPPAAAPPSAPSKVSEFLFDRPQLTKLNAGNVVAYKIERANSDPRFAADNFTDDIIIKVNKVADVGTREIDFKIFTGERARDTQTLADLTGNPLLILYLDRAVNSYSRLAGGSPVYLKNRFKIELRDNGKIEPAKFDYEGKSVDGYRVTVTPFTNDPNRAKMMGYEGSSFAMLFSDDVPGYFYELKSSYVSTIKENPKVDETIKVVRLDGAK